MVTGLVLWRQSKKLWTTAFVRSEPHLNVASQRITLGLWRSQVRTPKPTGPVAVVKDTVLYIGADIYRALSEEDGDL